MKAGPRPGLQGRWSMGRQYDHIYRGPLPLLFGVALVALSFRVQDVAHCFEKDERLWSPKVARIVTQTVDGWVGM